MVPKAGEVGKDWMRSLHLRDLGGPWPRMTLTDEPSPSRGNQSQRGEGKGATCSPFPLSCGL